MLLRFRHLVIGLGLWAGLAGLAAADPMLDLATQSGCFLCHRVDAAENQQTPLAPSYRQIAAHYQKNPNAFEYLTQRVMRGTVYGEQNWSGSIGMRFMPPNLNINRSEAATLVNWILSLNTAEGSGPAVQLHEQMMALATISGCFACHRLNPESDPRMIPLAPAFSAIAARFGGQPDAVKKLTQSVLHGTRAGEKKWHDANMQFMPPNVALDQAQATALVTWIIGLKH